MSKIKLIFGEESLTVDEALALDPLQLGEVLSGAIDSGIEMLEVEKFVIAIAEIDNCFAKKTIKAFAKWAHITPQRQALLVVLKEIGFYAKSSQSFEEDEFIDCPFDLDPAHSTEAIHPSSTALY